MTPEERRLWILSGAKSAHKRRNRSEAYYFDFLGIAFVLALLLIIVFVAIAGQA